jgi:tetratricopeptide (TPR) repeat protein
LGNLGNAYALSGDPRKAIEYYEQRLAIARKIGDPRGEGEVLLHISRELDKLGQREKAIDGAKAALQIFEQIESPHAGKVRQKLAEWQSSDLQEN